MSEQEYIVTLHNHEDLDFFYDEIETQGGTEFIPDRAVPVVNRRPLSRNTHYMLTEDEATKLACDSRVLAVELHPSLRGLEITRASWTQTSDFWSKDGDPNSTDRNWALLRCIEGAPRSYWGVDGVGNASGTVSVSGSGKNVDVVINDGHIDPAHPEFAVNADGTGGSRVIQYNWFQDRPVVGASYDNFSSPGTYIYTPYVDAGSTSNTDNNNHGCHVAGTAVGNTQGWARDANIYNITPYTGVNGNGGDFCLDHIRYWHSKKAVNPTTGRRNPTIVNMSWAYSLSKKILITDVVNVRFRGIVYYPAGTKFTAQELLNYYVYNNGTNIICPVRVASTEADIIDCIKDGIIIVAAAGNEYSYIDNYSAPSNINADYNNYVYISSVTAGTGPLTYCRGGISAAVSSYGSPICVGNVSSLVNESKRVTSNRGPRIDIFAPGGYIISSMNTSTTVVRTNPYAVNLFATDPRNTKYIYAEDSGTSMSSPQVAGVIACLMETWPNITQQQVLTYLQTYATPNQIPYDTTGGGFSDYTAILGSPNLFLYYKNERISTGVPYPKSNQGFRPTSGSTWPRPRIYRYGNK